MPTPTLLRLLMALVAGACVLFGVVGFTTMMQGRGAMVEASRNTQQLLRVQQIQAHLLNADATATNSSLVGGLESPAQRLAYTTAMSEASTQIVASSDAQPADRDALERLNSEIVEYSGAIEQARANNRQGFPIGTAYLNEASGRLRTQAMPVLDALADANTARVASQTRPLNPWPLSIVGVLALAAIGWSMWAVATRFRRIINTGLALSALGVLIGLVISLVAVNGAAATVRQVDTGTLATARHAATARVNGYDAKAYESLTLITRDRGAGNEGQWQTASWQVRHQLQAIPDSPVAARLEDAWAQHVVVHRRIRDLDQSGNWAAAVSTATGGELGSSNQTFAQFDQLASGVIADAGRRSVQTLGGHQIWLIVASLAALAVSIAAAVAGVRGIDARRREYA